MKKIISIVIVVIFFYTSCYLFDPNVEVQFINDSDLIIESISISIDGITYGGNILDYQLIPNKKAYYTIAPGTYNFKFDTAASLTFYSELSEISEYDFYEIHIVNKVTK
ncbi:MAG: hypothetical protein HQ557_14150 [Bacteroidetes bacterium]|nr:hypothetical protein [Bacteroidota bacterium]